MSRVNPKIDLAFKKLFGVDKNKDLLISLINSMLSEEDKISTITLKNPYNLPDYLKGKLSILDIKAEDEKGRRYNIEMQIIGHDDFGLRSLYYLAKAFIEQIGAGGNFRDLNKTIVINIVDFEFFDDTENNTSKQSKEKRYHREIAFRDIETLEKYPQLDYFSIHFVELPKYNDDLNKVKTTLERWITFLNKAGELTKDNIPSQLATKEIRKAVKELTIMYFDDSEREHYDRQQIILMDERARLATALRKGRDEGMEEVARQMKLDNEPIEKIMKFTGLSKDKIDKL